MHLLFTFYYVEHFHKWESSGHFWCFWVLTQIHWKACTKYHTVYFRSFADRLIAERFFETINTSDSDLKPVLSQVYDLYLNTILEKNLSWFIISGLLSPADVGRVRGNAAELCAALGPQALPLCDSFAITDTMLSAPIALDWVGYNSYDNQGELMSETEWNKTVRKV